MLRVLPYAVAGVLVIYCLVDIAQADPADVRVLPRWLWALLVLVPFAGAAAWLWLGRPRAGGGGSGGHRPARSRPAPDDDPDFLRRLGGHHPAREEFSSWEDELGGGDEAGGQRPK